MKIVCTNCSAQVSLPAQAESVTCEYCGAVLVVEADAGVPHLVTEPVVPEEEVPFYVRKALAANEISAEPDDLRARLVHFPFWRVVPEGGKGRVAAAFNPPAEEMLDVSNPGGQEGYYDEEIHGGGVFTEPTTLLDEVRAGLLQGDGEDAGKVKSALVHLPFYEVEYTADGRRCRMWLEAVSGAGYAAEWPPSAEREKTAVLAAVSLGAAAVFAVQGFVLPGWALLLAVPATGAVVYALSRALLKARGW